MKFLKIFLTVLILIFISSSISETITNQKQYTIHFIGNAHIDMAWKWRWNETIEICKNTFSDQIKLMEKYKDFIFAQSQAQAYLAMEENAPEVFNKIKKYVNSGNWDIVGGMWVEPDLNILSGESLVRQLLYGKLYLQEKFGVDVKVGWNPDSFGHSAMLPQILKKSGIDYYVFCRGGKGENIFWWESKDGSKILAYIPPGWYNDSTILAISAFNKKEIFKLSNSYEEKYKIKDVMKLYGIGDHGGGATDLDINFIGIFNLKKNYPVAVMNKPENYFKKILEQNKDYPTYRGELNPVFEGCYTSGGNIKTKNRLAENKLLTAEFLSSIAHLLGLNYPQEKLLYAYRFLLFNHFHDVICGTSIKEVFEDTYDNYDKLFKIADEAITNSLRFITDKINTEGEGTPVVVFNPLSFERDDIVKVILNCDENIKVIDEEGEIKISQITNIFSENGKRKLEVIFSADNLPPLGYRVYHLIPLDKKDREKVNELIIKKNFMENKYFKIEIDKYGNIKSIFDKINKQEVVKKGDIANQLIAFEDEDNAWGIRYTGKSEKINSCKKIFVKEKGLVRGKISIQRNFRNSVINQDIIIYNNIPRIDFITNIKWAENNILLKALFPLSIESKTYEAEIPYGTITRETSGEEMPILNWVDLSDGRYGVSIINNGKYGCSVKDNTIGLTLLRSPKDPNKFADIGEHNFTYSIYFHKGDYREGKVIREGIRLNQPTIAFVSDAHKGSLPAKFSFVQIEPDNLIVSVFKKAEKSDEFILRFYETEGKETPAVLQFLGNIENAEETDLLERPQKSIENSANKIMLTTSPYEIKTVKVRMK